MTASTNAVRPDLVPRALLVLAAASAVVAAVAAIPTVLAAGTSTVLVESWRMYGFAVFAGVFALLAAHPGRHVGLWLLAIAHKLAMTGTALAVPAAKGASTIVVADGVLAVMLVLAFVLARPWRAARHDRVITGAATGAATPTAAR